VDLDINDDLPAFQGVSGMISFTKTATVPVLSLVSELPSPPAVQLLSLLKIPCITFLAYPASVVLPLASRYSHVNLARIRRVAKWYLESIDATSSSADGFCRGEMAGKISEILECE
jgi:hypothetical protein